MSESFIKVASLSLATLFKKGSGTRVFLLIFQNFLENIFSRASLDNSVLKQLLALSFPVIYSWQLSSSEKSLVSKKLYPYISRILQICYTDFFFHFICQMLAYLVGYAKCMLYSDQPTVLLSRRYLKTILLTLSTIRVKV